MERVKVDKQQARDILSDLMVEWLDEQQKIDAKNAHICETFLRLTGEGPSVVSVQPAFTLHYEHVSGIWDTLALEGHPIDFVNHLMGLTDHE